MRYFEDVEVGEERELGTYEVTAEEILEFAETYDPQPMHVDPEAAAETPFGGLIASGWHTSAMTMRLLVDGPLEEVASIGAMGIDDLRWRQPVRPGDTLTGRIWIDDKEVWDEDRGLVYQGTEVWAENEDFDGDDQGDTDDRRTVLTMVGLVLFARRE